MTQTEPVGVTKSSGFDWIGVVPRNWSVRKLGSLFAVIGSGTTPPREAIDYYGGDTPWVTTGELRESRILATQETVNEAAIRGFSALRKYPSDSVVIAMYGATVGRLGILGIEATTNQACCVFAFPSGVLSKFVYYLLHAAKSFLVLLADGGGQPNINQEKLRQLRVPVPALDEQEAIVVYLDRETAEIDAFIADQEELIGLLAERRAATISHAVTKGLDPTVPMKDSGIEWLGKMPEAWTLQKLGWLARIGNGSTPSRENPEYWGAGTIPWLSSTVVNQDRIESAAEFVTSLARAECHLPVAKAGSVLVGLTGQGRTRGMAARLTIDCTISQHLAYVGPRAALDFNFAYWVITSGYQYLRLQSDGNGGTKGGLTCEELGDLRIPLPPLEQQRSISTVLERETVELSATIADAREAITLSKERRAALISAAVTGKIDVREHGVVA